MDQAYAIHESLHAAYDLLRTRLDGNSEEASAYVVAALDCRMTGLARPLWANGPIYASAAAAAETPLRQRQKGNVGIPMVGLTERETLRLAVMFDPVYGLNGHGGVTGCLLGAQFAHAS